MLTPPASEIAEWAKSAHNPSSRLEHIRFKIIDLLEESQKFDQIRSERGNLLASEQRELDRLRSELRILEQVQIDLEAEQEHIREQFRRIPYSNTANSATARGALRTEGTYRPDTVNISFFRDVVMSRNDPSAAERLQQNQREQLDRLNREERDITSADPGGGGFIPPAYLPEGWAALPRADRPFADAVPKWPMPDAGTQLSVPRVQSGTAVASQASENAAIQETDMDTESVTANLVAIAGMQDVSLQAIERSYPGLDRVIYDDLRAAYDAELDRQLINGSGAAGQHLGIRNVTGKLTVTYTDGTPTGAELLPKLYDGIQQVATQRMRNANAILLHPRRAAWLAKELSSTFPLFQQGQLTQAVGQQEGGFVQSFGGLRVILDPNISTVLGAGTNEDEVAILHIDDLMLMEEPIQAVRFDDVGSATLTVRLRLHAFSFFMPKRQPKSICFVQGTGLAQPAF